MAAGEDEMAVGLPSRSGGDPVVAGADEPSALGSSAAVDRAASVGDPAAIEASPGASADDLAIAEALSSGALDGEAARARLIDEVIAARVGEGADAEEQAQLRAELEQLLATDPHLQSLLAP